MGGVREQTSSPTPGLEEVGHVRPSPWPADHPHPWAPEVEARGRGGVWLRRQSGVRSGGFGGLA